MILTDERNDIVKEFYYEKGISEYVSYLNDGKKALNEVGYLEGMHSEIDIEVAFQFTETYSEQFISFVNNVRTKDGGTHEQGLKTSITNIHPTHRYKHCHKTATDTVSNTHTTHRYKHCHKHSPHTPL